MAKLTETRLPPPGTFEAAALWRLIHDGDARAADFGILPNDRGRFEGIASRLTHHGWRARVVDDDDSATGTGRDCGRLTVAPGVGPRRYIAGEELRAFIENGFIETDGIDQHNKGREWLACMEAIARAVLDPLMPNKQAWQLKGSRLPWAEPRFPA